MQTQQPLTPAQEDYLEAIFELASRDTGAHVDAIAKRVGVHKSTVIAALHTLAARKLVDYVPYKPVTLTARGNRVGAAIRGRHETLTRFLVEVLGIEHDLARKTACKMEHVMPPEVIERFTNFADFIETCPHTNVRFSRGFGYFCQHDEMDPTCERCMKAAQGGDDASGMKARQKNETRPCVS